MRITEQGKKSPQGQDCQRAPRQSKDTTPFPEAALLSGKTVRDPLAHAQERSSIVRKWAEIKEKPLWSG